MSRHFCLPAILLAGVLAADSSPPLQAAPPAVAAPPVEEAGKVVPIPPEQRRVGRVDITRDSGKEYLVRQALQSQVELQLPNNKLKEVASYLSQIHGIPIHFDVQGLGATGHSELSRVSASVSGVTLREALKKVLPKGLGVVIQSDGLLITSAREADRALYTRIYDLRPMVAAGKTPDELIRKVTTAIEKEKIEGGSIVHKDSMLYVKQNQTSQDIVLDLLIDETKAVLKAAPPPAPAK
ncbi:hypothetical protein [Planctomyces sp. SH-PL14]|uniref:hypothetical protein n=1 Tax=Planctomyces sp. SH-PL14 TaxID=1632864 RepID=UPI00078BCDE1|nr:hypothetical protein [Planctomyces sp. SH-PL14]AMV21444.1 hypothetical protein VT03_26310 [Planctomyces sp. SH-PL14]